MGLFTKREFADRCGIRTKALSTYIARNKVILSGDYIDDSIEQNKFFLESRENKPNKFEQPKPRKPKSISKVNHAEVLPELSRRFDLETEKKEADIEKSRLEIEISRIKRDKLYGNLIPTELVKQIFSLHSKSVITAFKNAADNLIINFSKKNDLTRIEIAELRSQLTNIINIAVNECIEESKKSVTKLVKDYYKNPD